MFLVVRRALDETGIAEAIGLAASMASGIRAGFGTMTKPMHVGRTAWCRL
jgi:2-methylcitrate dehydratase PrpD